jgi:hypothetical protein
MKINVNRDCASEKISFPFLLESNGLIVLAISLGHNDLFKGVVLENNFSYFKNKLFSPGYVFSGWDLNDFHIFNGTVTLENE